MFQDTIAAISTAPGIGAVSMIRISGEDAFEIAGKLCKKDFSDVKGYTIQYGTAYEDQEPVDEVLLSFFKGPRSYTGEDVVEVSCHGGVYITRKILSLILGCGATMARRGEFTERAFLNCKMDLSQAEGVNDLINAKDENNAKSAIHSLKGSVKRILDPLEEDLTQILAQIEVNIDYPEYDDVEVLTSEVILPMAKQWVTQIDQVIQSAVDASLIKDGIDTVILGRPNVGKSSLLNALLEEDKAIVTDVAGTTRDLVEGQVKVGEVTLNLIDTAGIRESDNAIEQIGIQKSLNALQKAKLVILVLDGSQEMTEEDQELLKLTETYPRIIVYNKKDITALDGKLNISAKDHDIDALKDEIATMYEKQLIAVHSDTLNNERQIGLAMHAKTHVNDAIMSLENGAELDLVTVDLQSAWHDLREITGKASREDLLDEIFSRFCLGK